MQSRILRSSYPWPKTANPTPYQIFHLPVGASQSEIKKRYYELVLLYHPDKQTSPSKETNERFHKLVAANDILCDKTRRSRFDHYGDGWTGTVRKTGSRYERYNRRSHTDTAQWDQFYTGNREEKYTSNANFVGFIVFFSTVGAVIQALRLSKASQEINERADKNHFNTARDLAESRRMARDMGRDERRRLFLAQRSGDVQGYGN